MPDGTDNVSAYPVDAAQSLGVLDNATLYTEGVLASRPAVGSVEHGRIYYATDTGQLAWANGTVWTPLGPFLFTSAASNLTASAGQWVSAAGGVTITLPSAATANQVICVQANATVTGTLPVTVSGSSIYGVGLNGASSFPLGTANASVLLQSTGSAWVIVSGQQDTGWVALTLAGGMSVTAGFYTPSARLRGDTVQLKGSLTAPTTSASGRIATVPAACNPSSTVGIYGVGFGQAISGSLSLLFVTTSGSIQCNQTFTGEVHFDSATYTIN